MSSGGAEIHCALSFTPTGLQTIPILILGSPSYGSVFPAVLSVSTATPNIPFIYYC